MTSILRICVSAAIFRFLAITSVLACSSILFASPPVASLRDQIAQCADIKTNDERLQCYDQIAKTKMIPPQRNFITPGHDFLQSELRVNRNTSEYNLTIGDFLAMLHTAKMDNNRHIEVVGWEKRQQSFLLHITMRRATVLSFEHVKTNKENFSVLAPVVVDGEPVDSSIFILNIAAMTPD